MRFRATLRSAPGGSFRRPPQSAEHNAEHKVQITVTATQEIEHGRRHQSIGRIRAVANWRNALSPVTEETRQALVQALIREAESYDADAIVELRFDFDSVRSADVDATPLRRATATGVAVRFAKAA
jgi:uncharacterized protein YbjQ (UPF0145 family)